MLVTLTGDSDGGEVVNAGSTEGAVRSLQSCFLCCRKVKGIRSCFMLLQLKSSSFPLSSAVIFLAVSSSMSQFCIFADINSDFFFQFFFLLLLFLHALRWPTIKAASSIHVTPSVPCSPALASGRLAFVVCVIVTPPAFASSAERCWNRAG